MNRTSEANVNSAFRIVCAEARGAGLDPSDWVLHSGNSSFGYQWLITSATQGNVGRPLGTTKREAYEALHHMYSTLYLVNKNR